MLLSIIQLKTWIRLITRNFFNKGEYDKDPESAVKAEQVRALDLMARKAYFSSRRQVETGSYLLLAVPVIFVLWPEVDGGK